MNKGFERKYGVLMESADTKKKVEEEKKPIKECDDKKACDKKGAVVKADRRPVKPAKKAEVKEDLGQDVAEYQKWVDYDMKKYHKISKETADKIKKAGLSVVKDQYGDYEVIAKEKVKEALKKRYNARRVQESKAKSAPAKRAITESEKTPDIEARRKKVLEAMQARKQSERRTAIKESIYRKNAVKGSRKK